MTYQKSCKYCGEAILMSHGANGWVALNVSGAPHKCRALRPAKKETDAKEGLDYMLATDKTGMCLYECVKCNLKFTGMHFEAARVATGRLDAVSHCGEAARWLAHVTVTGRQV